MPHYFDADENESIRAVADVNSNTHAFVLDTKINRYGAGGTGLLLVVASSGRNIVEVDNGGTINIRTPGVSAYSSYGEKFAYVGGDNYVWLDAGAGEVSRVAIGGVVDSVHQFRLDPQRTDGIPYFFNTSETVASNNLFEVQNNDTTMFTVGASGQIKLKPITKAIRSGLSVTAGTIIFQSDQGSGFRFYDGTNWIRLSGAFDN